MAALQACFASSMQCLTQNLWHLRLCYCATISLNLALKPQVSVNLWETVSGGALGAVVTARHVVGLLIMVPPNSQKPVRAIQVRNIAAVQVV